MVVFASCIAVEVAVVGVPGTVVVALSVVWALSVVLKSVNKTEMTPPTVVNHSVNTIKSSQD